MVITNIFQLQTVAQRKQFDVQSRNLRHFRNWIFTSGVEIFEFVSKIVWIVYRVELLHLILGHYYYFVTIG